MIYRKKKIAYEERFTSNFRYLLQRLPLLEDPSFFFSIYLKLSFPSFFLLFFYFIFPACVFNLRYQVGFVFAFISVVGGGVVGWAGGLAAAAAAGVSGFRSLLIKTFWAVVSSFYTINFPEYFISETEFQN